MPPANALEHKGSSAGGRGAGVQIAALALLLLVCLGAGAIGGALTAGSVDTWYPRLERPPWSPPDWVFAPVWTTLYALMAVAAWLVWRTPGPVRAALSLFAIQLGLNVLWSGLFFGLQSPGAALVDIALLFAAIVATLVLFWRRSRVAGALLVPYALWVAFAAALNAAIWTLNP